MKPKVYFIGQSHIDAAWLWTKDETLHVCCKETFENALRLMEKHPDFKFAQSSAQYYVWMEKHYPEIFSKIKQKVKEGRWEIVGGSWVECDLNMPSGESLVRQFLYGKKYFKETFGTDVRVAWFPDCFGFPATLPMILKGCDIDYFYTSKLSWNDTLRYPYYIFWWEAPDGSRVLTYIGIAGFHNEQIKRAISIMRELHNSDILLVTYGRGDHGGGPTDDDLKEIDEYRKLYDVKFGSVLDFFKEIESNANILKLPIVSDELYLQYHRGTYTTQARIKELNRKCEAYIETAEKISSIAYLFGLDYPQNEIEKLWKILLFNQFHDILCGSSIAEVYDDAKRELNYVLEECNKIIEKSMDYLSKLFTLRKNNIMIFNPTSWTVNAIVKIPFSSSKDEKVTYVAKDDENIYPLQKEGNYLIGVLSLPPLGIKCFNIEKSNKNIWTELFAHELDDKIVLENKFLRVIISKESGRIVSIFDKINRREVLGEKGVRIEIYDDTPIRGRVTVGTYAWRGMGADAEGMDAWEIFIFQQPFSVSYKVLDEPLEVKLVESGPVRARVMIKYLYKQRDRPDSLFIHYIDLYYDLPYIIGTIEVDWHALHRFAKLAIDVNFYSEKPVYEIPYGVIERRNIASPYASLFDRAKWEVPAHRWLDYYSEKDNYGIALINNSKYGFDIVNRTIRMSLLRAALHPPRYGTRTPGGPTDQGRHVIMYAIYPHKGDWRTAKVYKIAYAFNMPFIALTNKETEGKLGTEFSLVRVEPDNVIVTVVKKAEYDNSIVLRLHEVEGKESRVKVVLPFDIEKAIETNLIERELNKVKVEGKTLILEMKPYQLKTVKVFIKKS